jgi:hypothetical protein
MAGCSACRPFGTWKQQGVWLNRRDKAIIEPGLNIRPGLTVMRTSLAKLRQPSRATIQADDDLADMTAGCETSEGFCDLAEGGDPIYHRLDPYSRQGTNQIFKHSPVANAKYDPKKHFFIFAKNFQIPAAWLMPPGI